MNLRRLLEQNPEKFQATYVKRRLEYQSSFARLVKGLQEECGFKINVRSLGVFPPAGHEHLHVSGIEIFVPERVRQKGYEGIVPYQVEMLERAEKLFEKGRKQRERAQLLLTEFLRIAKSRPEVKLQAFPADVLKNFDAIEAFIYREGEPLYPVL